MSGAEPGGSRAEVMAVVLRLEARQGGWVRDSGRVVFGELLRYVGRRDVQLGAQLHDSGELKPFTCSGLLEGAAGDGSTRVDIGATYHIRVTGLTGEVCRAWERHFLMEPPQHLALQGCEFAVVGAYGDARQHKWAGSSTYGELLGRGLAHGGEWESGIALELAAPVAFRTRGLTMPLPLPNLVFGNLVDKWNAFSPLKFTLDVRRLAESEVGISSFRLGSMRGVRKQGSVQIGAQGQVKYRYLGSDREMVVALGVLAEYSRFAGVGIKTTMGMGQCRPVHGGGEGG